MRSVVSSLVFSLDFESITPASLLGDDGTEEGNTDEGEGDPAVTDELVSDDALVWFEMSVKFETFVDGEGLIEFWLSPETASDFFPKV